MQHVLASWPRARNTGAVKPEKDISERITDVAIQLAEEGGYDNVRQRDVAARAGIALGTLYKRFRSKEDILSAALERETAKLEIRLQNTPAKGDTAGERLRSFYAAMTRALVRRPHFARAVLRAMSSGQPEVSARVVAYQGRMTGLLIAAMRGVSRFTYGDAAADPPTPDEQLMAIILQGTWFAALVGWSAGLHTQASVVELTARTGELLLLGLEAEKKAAKKSSNGGAAKKAGSKGSKNKKTKKK